MTTTTKDLAAEYRAGLPRQKAGRKGVLWTGETFATYVNLLYPHITVVSGQEWSGNKTKYKFVCSIHGPYETHAIGVLSTEWGCQCQGCQSDKQRALAGTLRCPRSTVEEKELAATLRADGMSYGKIALEIGRSKNTVRHWLNPDARIKCNIRSARYKVENREQYLASQSRYSKEFQHGKANACASASARRLLETNTPELVLLDDEWCEVDRKETYRIHKDYLLSPLEKKEIQELYLECQHITEKTGVEHHVDHIQPLSKGGEHAMFNLQIIPASDNLSKNNTFRLEDQQLLIQRLFHQ